MRTSREQLDVGAATEARGLEEMGRRPTVRLVTKELARQRLTKMVPSDRAVRDQADNAHKAGADRSNCRHEQVSGYIASPVQAEINSKRAAKRCAAAP